MRRDTLPKLNQDEERGKMAEAIQEFANPLDDANGNSYGAVAYGEERADGTWIGWLEFRPVHGGATLRTMPSLSTSKVM